MTVKLHQVIFWGVLYAKLVLGFDRCSNGTNSGSHGDDSDGDDDETIVLANCNGSQASRRGHSGLSHGAIAGIVIGTLFIFLIILMVLCWRRRAKRRSSPPGIDPQARMQSEPRFLGAPVLIHSSSHSESFSRPLLSPGRNDSQMTPSAVVPSHSYNLSSSIQAPSSSNGIPQSSTRRPSSELHSEMVGYQKVLQEEHRKDSSAPADPPPSYQAINGEVF
ncbi:hypothetical protein EW146_g4074 [Bondarzewia mesenterica]|uniref:Mid2 domain-containing protein n=1 Tax=Bondarzewia mesenterica TaxID=1095465 RepID=A0A4S4M1G6_9AGAM|nr:hypothetical protein EW146_g4074 [Bondarzewia mesenterica]